MLGDFNNHEISENYVMSYNPINELYESVVKLKQGFYNYKYVAVDSNNKIIPVSYTHLTLPTKRIV